VVNNCFFGSFSICSNSANGLVILLGNPPEGSATLHQILLNECTGTNDPADPTLCANTAGTELFLSASDQASIESNSEQITEQTNGCIAGALCENTRVFIDDGLFLENEVIRIVAEDQAIVKANSEQELFQDNACEGAFAECINAGIDATDIFVTHQAIVEANSQQLLQQGNECTAPIHFVGMI
jgi:hypothetical protein